MTMKKLLGISLALIMLVGSTPFGFSEPLRVQLEQGIETTQIQCDNPNHVLVIRPNGNLACVNEKTSEKMGWEIITFTTNTNNAVMKVIEEIIIEAEDKVEEIIILSEENNEIGVIEKSTNSTEEKQSYSQVNNTQDLEDVKVVNTQDKQADENKELKLILNPENLLDIIPQDVVFDQVLKIPHDDPDAFAQRMANFLMMK